MRIITGYGRVRVEDRGGALYVRSQRGVWKYGVRMLPADASDPTYFTLETNDYEATHIALIRNDAGEITGLRANRVELVRTPDPSG